MNVTGSVLQNADFSNTNLEKANFTNTDLTGVLICLDSIEAVIDEAIEKKCNLVVAHHPIVFSKLGNLLPKKLLWKKRVANKSTLF